MRRLGHKFNAKPTVAGDGIRYASKKEAAYADKLKMMQKSGEILFYIRQVGLDLPGKSRHFIDFLVFYTDGTAEFIEVKGRDHPIGKLKRKQAEALYPIDVRVV